MTGQIPDTTPNTPPPAPVIPDGSPLEALPEDWQEYIRALRTENGYRRISAREAQEQASELQERLTALETQVANNQNQPQQQPDTPAAPAQSTPDVAALEAEIARLTSQLGDVSVLRKQVAQLQRVNIASEFGITHLADRLQGDTIDALREDAKKLAALVNPDSAQSGADDPPATEEPADANAPDSAPDPASPITVDGKPQPQDQQPGPVDQPPANTTQVPGGQSVGRTDNDRRREYFGGGVSTVFDGGNLTVTTKTVSQE